MDVLKELRATPGPELPPAYQGHCERVGCKHEAKYTIVLHFWPQTMHPLMRGKHNATRMFPAVVACEDHRLSLSEIGLHVIASAMGSVRELFKALSLDEPDAKDALIELQPLAEAAKLWREPTRH